MTEQERARLVEDLQQVRKNTDELWRDMMANFGRKGIVMARKVQAMRDKLLKIEERFAIPTSKLRL